MNRKLSDLLGKKVLFLDGAMGTMIQQANVAPEDFRGLDGCNEILVESRPDVISGIHSAYLEAGCDLIETNTFGANGVVLREYGVEHLTEKLNRRAAELAREVADGYGRPDKPRFVVGSVGPGTRLPSLGHIDFPDLVAAFEPQFVGLIEGGADAVCIETCQDLLQIKAALDALRRAVVRTGVRPVVFVSVTVESTGTMLVGSDVQTAITALWPMGPDVLGLNCATGPEEMKRHLDILAGQGPAHLMAMPNAGLPKNDHGRVVYPLGPEAFAQWIDQFVTQQGIHLAGGCCGTTPDHIRAMVQRIGEREAVDRSQRSRPAEVASLYQSVPLRQFPPPLLVGERANANGSKAFRDRLLADDLPGMLDVAKDQEEGGAHLLDVCVAYVGRNEKRDISSFVPLLAKGVRLPLCIDSTDPDVLEAALQRHGGRCVINSINLEDGENRLHKIADLASRHGAALIALTIDEQGMAMTAARKVEVAERMISLCVREHGLLPQDLLVDLLTFTVGSGDANTRNAAVETLDALAELKRRHPTVGTLLGVSNVSFGLKPAARRVLNSVFLHLAVERGLDAAIVNARGILPLYRISQARQDAATALLLNDLSAGDPLKAYMALFEGKEEEEGQAQEQSATALSPQAQLQRLIVDGTTHGLEKTVEAVLAEGTSPLALINELLIPAMRRVGELFGAGQMQLPFVLQSAETMKSAVALLEPLLQKSEVRSRGTLVLATVKGDVHDIGKNLVHIIVSNNGYKVVDLGIKVSLEEMLKALRDHEATALGMSGLLVKSTLVMKENLEEMRRRGVSIPVLLGGAALTREFVEGELRQVYGPQVFYCDDAFQGLSVMNALLGGGQSEAPRVEGDSDPLSRPRCESSRSFSTQTPSSPSPPAAGLATDLEWDGGTPPEIDLSIPVPVPPTLERVELRNIPLEQVFELLNETTLFRGQWRYRRGALPKAEYERLIEEQVRPTLASLKGQMLKTGLIAPRGVYQYVHCASEGRKTYLYDPHGNRLGEFLFPRKKGAPHSCIADYFRRAGEVQKDILGLFVVTVGDEVRKEVQSLFRKNKYKDYLHLHGLAVESAEATAEWLHRRMRGELGIDQQDDLQGQGMVRQGYRGSRYSFGYPACPNLEDQKTLFRILDPASIGVSLTEGLQMVPEYSVSALVVHHPQARYFGLD